MDSTSSPQVDSGQAKSFLKNHGKKVFIFSSKNNVSQELRTSADGYTDVLDIEDIWGKELKHRAELEKEHK